MLSNFIRRNGKRKCNRVIEPRSHQKSFSSSQPSQVSSPLVFDISEESLSPPTQNLPLVQLDLLNCNEEWFPQELLQSRTGSPRSSPGRTKGSTITQNNLTLEAHTNSSPEPSLSHSENTSPVTFRKKSIPAPIIIPDPDRLMPDVHIGHSTASARVVPLEMSPTNANGASLNHPSPSVSDNLSSISGTTLARALIASSFVLSSSDHHSSRHRGGAVRQDSATLPRGSFFLSDSGSPSPIPPVPPVPAMLVNASPDAIHPPTIKSGASTDSEYPMSDSYITSPETANSSVIPLRTSPVQEVPSRVVSALTADPVPAIPNTKPQREAGPMPARTRVHKNGVFDVPRTAEEGPFPPTFRGTTQDSSLEGSFLLNSDDHSLDEFDFVPPEPLVAVSSPESDSSASYVAPILPLPKRSCTNRGQWRRRCCGFGSKDVSLADCVCTLRQVHGTSSATTSEYDYGELFNYDLTVSPETSFSSSSASAGYQTFPETPMALSPLWSPGYAFLAKSDSRVIRTRLSSLRSAGRGGGRLHSTMKNARRQVGNSNGVGGAATLRRSRSSMLPKQRAPSPKQAESKLLPFVPVNDDAGISDETKKSLTTNTTESQHSIGLFSAVRHPLAHVSSASSYLLEEDGLRALAQYSSSSSSSSIMDDIDHLFGSAIIPTQAISDSSDKSPTSIPLPESPDASPHDSPALASSSTAVSSASSHPLQSSIPTASTVIGKSSLSKSLLSLPLASLGGSSSPSSQPPSALDEPRPRPHYPMATVSSSIAPNDLVSLSPSPSFVPPPPYHTVVSERIVHHPSSTSTPSLSRTPSTGPGHQHGRQASKSSVTSGSVRSRMRSRPPLPIGPRKPSAPGQALGSFIPGIRGRNASVSSVSSSDPASNSPRFSWRKLHSSVSRPPPKFQVPPPKWRGLTLEAAQWTFTSTQLQEIVSQATQQTSEGSSFRLLRPDVLEGEIVDEMHRLELQHMDVKAQYKTLARKRWMLMGTLAGHVEGVETSSVTAAVRTVEELAEVLSMLDGLANKMHDTVLQMAQLKSLRDVHNMSALAMAARKINELLVQQVAEKEQLEEQADTLRTERDEAWKHAEEIAQDLDALNDRISESGGAKAPNADASSVTSSKHSKRISAVRRSSVWQSHAGLRFRSRYRPGRSLSNPTRPTSLSQEDIPPVPPLPGQPSIGFTPSATGITSGPAYGSSTPETSAALALAEAQREVYEMLGLSLPPSQASSRRRTLSGSDVTRVPLPSPRPVSESLDARVRMRRMWTRPEWRRMAKSSILDERHRVQPLAIARR